MNPDSIPRLFVVVFGPILLGLVCIYGWRWRCALKKRGVI